MDGSRGQYPSNVGQKKMSGVDQRRAMMVGMVGSGGECQISEPPSRITNASRRNVSKMDRRQLHSHTEMGYHHDDGLPPPRQNQRQMHSSVKYETMNTNTSGHYVAYE